MKNEIREVGAGVYEANCPSCGITRPLTNAGKCLLCSMELYGDVSEAVESVMHYWWLATAGDKWSMNHLADAFIIGYGVPKDMKQARYWSDKFAKLQHKSKDKVWAEIQDSASLFNRSEPFYDAINITSQPPFQK